MKQHKTEDQLKDDIFNAYSVFLKETSSDRRQTYFGQLCDIIFRWCDNYLFLEAKEMGVEIVSAIKRVVNKNNKNIQKDKTQFIKYLRDALNNARNEFYRKNKNIIKFPRKIYEIEKVIEKQEINTGRNFSNEEKIQFISSFYNMTKEKAIIYLNAIHAKNIGKLDYVDDGEEHSILDSLDTKPVYMDTSLADPEDTMLLKYDLTVIQEAVELALKKGYKTTIKMKRALFTAYCIKRFKNFEGLLPVLDDEILETFSKSKEKPTQYEVYMKFRPKAKKASAEVRAHETLKVFLEELKSKLLMVLPPSPEVM